MSEKSSKRESIRVSNINKLLKRENIDQKDLADAINREPQNLSRDMVHGKISEKTCEKIINAFPEYRLEWLLGYSDIMTHTEWADSIQKKKDITADGMWGIIENSLNKEGKSLKFIHRKGQHINSSERIRADCYYSVVDSSGKEVKRLTATEMAEFEMKIQEYCDFLTGKYL